MKQTYNRQRSLLARVLLGVLLAMAGGCTHSPPGTTIDSTGQPAADTADIENRIHARINRERRAHGLKVLKWDPALSRIARSHSRDMAARGYLRHTTPEGLGPVDRCRRGGYAPGAFPEGGGTFRLGCAENLFQASRLKSRRYVNGVLSETVYYSRAELAAIAVKGWMESPGHRANILTADWTRQGIGAAAASDGTLFVTQLFN